MLRRHCVSLMIAAAASLAAGRARSAPVEQDTDVERATRSLLLAIARVGKRLVAVGAHGNILLSDDDGATWRLTPSGTDALLTAVSFESPTAGWVVGYDATILHTTDAGATWSLQQQDKSKDTVLTSVTPAASASDPAVATGEYGLALTQAASGWTPFRVEAEGDDYHLNSVARLSDGGLVIVGEAGQAYRRLPGQEEWTPIPLPYQGSQFGCLPTSDGGVLSYGLRGNMFRLSGGATPAWQKIDSGTEAGITGGALIGDGRIALVGAAGTVLAGKADGSALKSVDFPNRQTLSGIAEAANGQFVVVGERGVTLVGSA